MNATAFDPSLTYDVFTPEVKFTGMSNKVDFLRGHGLVEGLPKSADAKERTDREGALHWFEDQGYRVERSKRPTRED